MSDFDYGMDQQHEDTDHGFVEGGCYPPEHEPHDPHTITALFTDGTSIEVTDGDHDGRAEDLAYDANGDGYIDGGFIDVDGDGVLDFQYIVDYFPPQEAETAPAEGDIWGGSAGPDVEEDENVEYSGQGTGTMGS
jgi:hypothetical protein